MNVINSFSEYEEQDDRSVVSKLDVLDSIRERIITKEVEALICSEVGITKLQYRSLMDEVFSIYTKCFEEGCSDKISNLESENTALKDVVAKFLIQHYDNSIAQKNCLG